MSKYNEQAMVYADLIRDKNRIKSQIASSTDTVQITKRFNETVIPKHLHYRAKTRLIGTAFILGHPDNGVLGTDKLGVGTYGSLVLDSVNSPGNNFVEYYDQEDYRDSDSSCSIETTDAEISFVKGQFNKSTIIFKNDQDITLVKPLIRLRSATGSVKVNTSLGGQRIDIYCD